MQATERLQDGARGRPIQRDMLRAASICYFASQADRADIPPGRLMSALQRRHSSIWICVWTNLLRMISIGSLCRWFLKPANRWL